MRYSHLLLIFLTILVSIGCEQSGSRKNEEDQDPTESRPLTAESISGNYVTEDYLKRDEGYDWVAVSISAISSKETYIRIQSRADRKKPTCTFEGIGSLGDDGRLTVEFEGQSILFLIENNVLYISTGEESELDFLMYFCSGGGSIAGNYLKIDEALDERQLRPSGYNKILFLQGITFDIHASQQGSLNLLTIQPSGLEIDNSLVIHDIDGNVTNAEIEDLNSDGSPELLVYITSAGSGSYGSVIGYSVNNQKSMSQIYFPPTADNPEISEGYMGHDEFTIIETTFAQRFPIYKPGDTNSNPTGGIRQVQYKLVDGDGSRIFKVDKVLEFSIEF